MARILRMPSADLTDVLTPNHSLYARQSTASLQELRRELVAQSAQCAVDLDADAWRAGFLAAILQHPEPLQPHDIERWEQMWREAFSRPHSCDWERQYYQNRIDCIDRILRRRTTGLEP